MSDATSVGEHIAPRKFPSEESYEGMSDITSRRSALFVSVGSRACAIPVQHVVETMRPLPIEPIAGMPGFVRGLSLIRGEAVPVVDLHAVISAEAHDASYKRFVTLKSAERTVAIAVDGVLGVRQLEAAQLEQLPELLGESHRGVVEAVGRADQQLLLVLRASRLIPDQLWATFDLEKKAT